MSRAMSFIELEKQFDDAMATVSSLYELMWNTEAGTDYRHETIQRIGRGGLFSAKKAQKAFHDLMELHLNEQMQIKQKISGLKKPSSAPLVERAVSIMDKTQIIRAKQ